MPQTVGDRNPYATRNQDRLTLFRANRLAYARSFFPQTTQDWNELPQIIRESRTLTSFNSKLNIHFPRPKTHAWYGTGDRRLDIIHTRLRLGCSLLKYHLVYNLHVEEDPHCVCGTVETVHHFFFECVRFRRQREELIKQLSELTITHPTLDILLCGKTDLPFDVNINIVKTVHEFIDSSNRFTHQ